MKKLASLAAGGCVKKLLALAGLGAAAGGATVVRFKSGSGGEIADQDNHTARLGEDDFTKGIMDGALRTAHDVTTVLKSLRAAWHQRREANKPCSDDNLPSISTGVEILSCALGELAARTAAEDPNEALTRRLAGHWAVRNVFVAAAAAPPGSPTFSAASNFIVAALGHSDSALALLTRPHTATALLVLAAHSLDVERATLSALRSLAAEDLRLPNCAVSFSLMRPSPADVASAVHAAVLPRQRAPRRELALVMLRLWCRGPGGAAAVLNMAPVTLGQRLGEVAGCLPSVQTRVQTEIAALMGALAREAPDANLSMLRMQAWLYPLLCMAADAAGDGHWTLARSSLAAFSACLHRGVELPTELMHQSALPLLHSLADATSAAAVPAKAPSRAKKVEAAAAKYSAGISSKTVPPQERGPMRCAAAATVQALAQGPKVSLPPDERASWAETLLGWLTAACDAEERSDGLRGESKSAGAASDEERVALVEALSSLSGGQGQGQGVQGMQVAHTWLAELIIQLSIKAQEAQARRAKAGGRDDGAASAADRNAAEAAEPAGYSWWWSPTLWWKRGSSDGDTAFAAASASSAVSAGAEETTPAADPALLFPAPQAPQDGADGATRSSWTYWLPGWAGGGVSPSQLQAEEKQAAAAAGGVTRSDSELALYVNAADVGPAYARSVAADLLEASGRVGVYSEPPPSAEDALSPAAIAAYSAVAAVVDIEVADRALTQSLKVLCALAAGEGTRREWLVRAGVLRLLRRLAIDHSGDELQAIFSAAAASPEAAAHLKTAKQRRQQDIAPKEATGELARYEEALGGGEPPLAVLRQACRLVALLSVDMSGAAAIAADRGWLRWLNRMSSSSDCKVSSCTAKALLNVESAAATAEDPSLPALPPLLPLSNKSPGAGVLEEDYADDDENDGAEAGTPESPLEAALQAVKQSGLEAAAVVAGLAGAFQRVPPCQRLVLQDGIHLFDPMASHHEALARRGIADQSQDAPVLDVVFVHGIRGGAFATWRREGVMSGGAAREALDSSVCWPTSWLAPALGRRVRLLSAEYAAPASGWEGESLPFPHTAEQVAAKLAAAGVGERPVVFVTHSMGGMVVKEILARGRHPGGTQAQKKLSSASAGVVFYSVPHAGSRLADWGWTLRYLGAAPAKAVEHLTTGPRVEALNEAVRAMARAGLPVLSFSEGLPTQLSYVSTHIVPHESAYPGYGEFVVLALHDHISVCKPTDQQDPAFSLLLRFLRERVKGAERDALDRRAAAEDPMEAAL